MALQKGEPGARKLRGPLSVLRSKAISKKKLLIRGTRFLVYRNKVISLKKGLHFRGATIYCSETV